jgi:hypothetical protein
MNIFRPKPNSAGSIFDMKNHQYFYTAAIVLFFYASTVISQIPGEVSKRDATCHERGARILVLGTFHFDNPGLDSVNVEADDVLAEKRQREIAEVLDKLAAFKPTKIAVESLYKNNYWPTRYKQYREGKYTLGRNEIEQIGFRLAERLNLPTVHPVDYPMFMSGLLDSEIEFKKPAESEPKTDAAEEKPAEPKPLTAARKKFRETPLIEHLRNINREENIRRSHEQYLTMLLPDFENPAIYEKADRVTNWYKRNLRIFSNLNRITEFDGKDRILFIVGAGHLKIINEFAIDAPQFCFVEAETYLNAR